MSNLMRALTEGLSVSEVPESRFVVSAEQQELFSDRKHISNITYGLRKLHVQPARTVEVPEAFMLRAVIDTAQFRKLKVARGIPCYAATTSTAIVSARLRTKDARQMLVRTWKHVPEEDREVVAKAIASKGMLMGGAQNTLGRLEKYYPSSTVSVALSPPLEHEVRLAMRRCGVAGAAPPGTRRKELFSGEIRINPSAEVGFPVGGTWRTEGTATRVLGISRWMLEEIDLKRHPDEVSNLYNRWLWDYPDLLALKGKAKADVYNVEKALDLDFDAGWVDYGGAMRFYNVVPGQVKLLLQMVTQRLEEGVRTATTDPDVWSAQGLSLAHRGAAKLVERLDERLQRDGYAFTHCGDDSWVILKRAGKVVMLSVDCSSFDLTQRRSVMEPIDRALEHELAGIDPKLARFWYHVISDRLTVVASTVAAQMTDGGPSGLPLQSKRNDLLMNVYLERLVRRLLVDPLDKARVEKFVEVEGDRLGLEVRLECYDVVEAASIKDALRHVEFLYLGYRFYTDDHDVVSVYSDMPRQLSQLPYPNPKWFESRDELHVAETVRLASMVLAWGVPPPRWEDFFERYREEAIRMLRKLPKDYPIDELFYGEDVQVATRVQSAAGLCEVLEDPERLLRLWRTETEKFVSAPERLVAPIPLVPMLVPEPVPVYTSVPTWDNAGRPPAVGYGREPEARPQPPSSKRRGREKKRQHPAVKSYAQDLYEEEADDFTLVSRGGGYTSEEEDYEESYFPKDAFRFTGYGF